MCTCRRAGRRSATSTETTIGAWTGTSPSSVHQPKQRIRAIGEISPQYLYREGCPARIAAAIPEAKLLVILRHPVDRAYSHYGFVVQRRNFQGSFEEFLALRPTMLDKGFYSRYLDRYPRHSNENGSWPWCSSKRCATGTRPVVPSRRSSTFRRWVPRRSAGSTQAPCRRFGSLSNVAVTTGRRLRKTRLETVVDLGGRLGMRRALNKGKPLPRLDGDLRKR